MSEFLKASEVATRLNVSLRSAQYLISSGKIPSIKLGPQTVRVDKADLEKYITDLRDKNAAAS